MAICQDKEEKCDKLTSNSGDFWAVFRVQNFLLGTLAPLCDLPGDFQVRGKVKRGLVVIGYCLVLLEPEVDMKGTDKMYVYLEPVCPLFWWLNPSKQGLFQSKQGSFGFQVQIM